MSAPLTDEQVAAWVEAGTDPNATELGRDIASMAVEVQGHRSRRCDGCDNSEHLVTCEYHCGLLNIYVVSDFACNSWVPRNGDES